SVKLSVTGPRDGFVPRRDSARPDSEEPGSTPAVAPVCTIIAKMLVSRPELLSDHVTIAPDPAVPDAPAATNSGGRGNVSTRRTGRPLDGNVGSRTTDAFT